VIPFFTPDDGLAAELEAASRDAADPLWRMPLWAGYASSLDSDIADIKNDPDAWAQAGSVTAALFCSGSRPRAPGCTWTSSPGTRRAGRLAGRRRGAGDPRPLCDAESPLRMSGDPRARLARPDLAARNLEGLVHAERFAEPRAMQVSAPVAGLHTAPDASAELADQALFGEVFDVLEVEDGWAWGRRGATAMPVSCRRRRCRARSPRRPIG